MSTVLQGRSYAINFAGDVMLGRLIDQLRTTHVDCASEARAIQSILRHNPSLRECIKTSAWGSTLDLFQSADLNIINLETAVTTHPTPWPNKVFNYRMHPANIDALNVANVHYAGLANNHTLDFCEEGLAETVKTLKTAGIKYAGAGANREEALGPAILPLPSESSNGQTYDVFIFSASDHPSDWSDISTFHFIDYTASTRERLRNLLNPRNTTQPALKVFSVHWGPNYSWEPADNIQSLAHFVIDECGVDIVHGHSSHHIQGVEVYKKKLIIYGCGDFVDDYATNNEFRNDLGAIWRVIVCEQDKELKKLGVERLEVFPTKTQFIAETLHPEDDDYQWVSRRFKELCASFNVEVKEVKTEEGEGKKLVVCMNESTSGLSCI